MLLPETVVPFDIHFLSDGRCDGESNRSSELECSVQRFISKPGLKIHTATQANPPPRPCATHRLHLSSRLKPADVERIRVEVADREGVG